METSFFCSKYQQLLGITYRRPILVSPPGALSGLAPRRTSREVDKRASAHA